MIAVLNLIAQTPTPTTEPASGLGGLVIFLPFVALLFWMMRKQGKQRREHMDLVSSIQIGDEIETVAGMFGRVTGADDEALTVELTPGVAVRMSRGAVRRKILDLGDGV